MSKRITPFLIIPAIGVALALAVYGVEYNPEAIAAPHWIRETPAPMAPAEDLLPSDNGGALPPDHPPIGAAASPHGPVPAPPTAGSEPPALVWTIPAAWQEAPSPNAMRLATYRAPGGVEVSVARAGGETEANIERWVAQFDDVGHQGRVEKTVHGLHVVTVDVSGTYVGGGANMGGPAEPKPDWTMVGTIVESRSPPYFFKMTGPSAAIRAARPVFDRFVDGISPT